MPRSGRRGAAPGADAADEAEQAAHLHMRSWRSRIRVRPHRLIAITCPLAPAARGYSLKSSDEHRAPSRQGLPPEAPESRCRWAKTPSGQLRSLTGGAGVRPLRGSVGGGSARQTRKLVFRFADRGRAGDGRSSGGNKLARGSLGSVPCSDCDCDRELPPIRSHLADLGRHPR